MWDIFAEQPPVSHRKRYLIALSAVWSSHHRQYNDSSEATSPEGLSSIQSAVGEDIMSCYDVNCVLVVVTSI